MVIAQAFFVMGPESVCGSCSSPPSHSESLEQQTRSQLRKLKPFFLKVVKSFFYRRAPLCRFFSMYWISVIEKGAILFPFARAQYISFVSSDNLGWTWALLRDSFHLPPCAVCKIGTCSADTRYRSLGNPEREKEDIENGRWVEVFEILQMCKCAYKNHNYESFQFNVCHRMIIIIF
jgi:hypothetical protein